MRIKLLNPFLPIFSWEKIGILNGEKMKNENEKTISLTNGIWRKAGNEIMKNVLTIDEAYAHSHSVLVYGNSLNSLNIELIQTGNYISNPYKYVFKIPCKSMFDFIPVKYFNRDWDYTEFYAHVQKKKVREYVLQELESAIQDYLDSVRLAKHFNEW